MLYIQGAALTH